MGGFAGSVTAAEHRMLTQRPLSDADEIRLLKRDIAAAKRAQQQQTAAAADTGAGGLALSCGMLSGASM